MSRRAVVLLSGGLDSASALAVAGLVLAAGVAVALGAALHGEAAVLHQLGVEVLDRRGPGLGGVVVGKGGDLLVAVALEQPAHGGGDALAALPFVPHHLQVRRRLTGQGRHGQAALHGRQVCVFV